MVQSLKQPVIKPGSLLVFEASWATYTHFLKMFRDSNRVRLTFDRGTLQIMSPGWKHDGDSRSFVYFVQILAEEWKIPVRAAGSVTMRKRTKRAGLEADESFWLKNSPKMAGKDRLDLRVDPPADLSVEVELRRSPVNRMNVYARLGVPEVWRVKKGKIAFFRLDGTKYEQIETSLNFPGLRPSVLETFVANAKAADDWTDVLREFRAAVRKLRPKSH